jgi:hypothetical protein
MWYEYEVKEAEGKVVAEGSAFPTYEEALSTAIRMAVEYLKEKCAVKILKENETIHE